MARLKRRTVFGRPLQVTVRPMLSDRCLSCLSVTLVYCSQTVGWIKMPLGTEVCLGARNTVLDGDPTPSTERGVQQAPTFRPMSIVAKRSPILATAELLFHFHVPPPSLSHIAAPDLCSVSCSHSVSDTSVKRL